MVAPSGYVAAVSVKPCAEGHVAQWPAEQTPDPALPGATEVVALADLARLLRQLRRRQARQQSDAPLTYRELAAKAGWSHGIIGAYLAGDVLPPTDRFDVLIRLLGATSAEQSALATARDRVEERRRGVAPGAAAGLGLVVPRQLPPAVRCFVGRAAELAVLNAFVDQATEPGATAVISAVDGTAGIGKTALAVHWAHRVADRFPDGQLYVNLRGFDPSGSPMTAAEALRGFLDAFAVSPERIPAGLQAQAGLYRSLLSGKRVLVVLDNARDAEQVHPLLPGSPTALALVTSRNWLTSLVAADGAHPITLDLLSTAQARELLTRRIGHDRVAAEPDAVDEIIARCARLPLALTIVAARAGAHPQFPLAALADELRDTGARLDAFDGGNAAIDVRTVLSWSFQRLSTQAARLFRLLGLHPGPDLGVPAAASLAGLPVGQARQLLAELTRAHLVTEHAPSRFTFHDLLRAYAAELTHAHDIEVERRAALHRMLDHYLRVAHAAGSLLNPLREAVAMGSPQPEVVPERPADRPEALAWFTAEHPVLVAAVTLAADTGFGGYACRLAWIISGFFQLRGHWQEWAAVQRTALAAAQRLADRAWQARIHRELVGAYAWLGSYDDGQTHFQHALDLYGELGDEIGLSRTHRTICLMLERQGHYPQALNHALQSRDLLLGTDDRAGQAYAFNSVGWYQALVGDFQAAESSCQQAIILLRETGDRDGEATAWDSLGYAHHHLGDYQQAIACYRQALDLFREAGDRYYEAPTLNHLGDTYRVVGDHDAARDAWRRALTILEELQPPEAAEIRAKLHDVDQATSRHF
jgi:tetratricopeptide (TPR) repeat protein